MANKPHSLFLFICFLLLAYSNTTSSQDVKQDWDNYPIWENTTKYSKIYIVNQSHKNACDSNAGTENEPLRSISAAVRLVKAGEKVLIHQGVYREMVEPFEGGTGPDKMISFESVPGHEVIIKGSGILKSKWLKEIKTDKNSISPSITASRSQTLWITTLDESYFKEGYYPFRLPNINEQEFERMPWLKPMKNESPFTLARGMIFQNGQRMIQLNHYGDLIHIAGSFWVDTDKKTVHIHPFGDKNPNEDVFEITVQGHLLKPKKVGLNFIQVKGLIFEHCANGFLMTGTGALITMGGHHWIFENNLIREINAYGLEFGSDIAEGNEAKQENISVNSPDQNGYMNIRNNIIYACGIAGIHSKGAQHAIIKNNEVSNCGWQEAEFTGECAGIKLLKSNHCLVSNNLVSHIKGGAGIWLQLENKFSRVTRNILHDIMTTRGTLIIEASREVNLVDNNFIWNVNGAGINGNNSDNQLYYHNLVANTSEAIIKISSEGSDLDSIKFTAQKNQISNNIFIDFGEKMDLSSSSNTVKNNLFVFNTKLKDLELKKWQEKIISQKVTIMRADADFNPNTLAFKWNSKFEVQAIPSLKEIKTDFTNEKRSSMTIPGPFLTLPRNFDYYVSMTVR